MWCLSYGEIPDRKRFIEYAEKHMPYPMKITDGAEWQALATAINQGIDSRLEAISCEERAYGQTGSGHLTIKDAASMHTLIRRLVEGVENWDDEDPAGMDLVSCILRTLEIEWG